MSHALLTRTATPRPKMVPVRPELSIEDDSPFGLQGLAREPLTLLKPEHINSLAVTLALTATPTQIRNPKFIASLLARHPEWVDEYQVVHLIEKSLWIQGQSDLVMTLLRNPSQIPDNPPDRILRALAKANSLHPDATVWYGVPLFSDEVNDRGLPIPRTAREVHEEAARRVSTAQQHALRWRHAYRLAANVAAIPGQLQLGYARLNARVERAGQAVAAYWARVRRDSRRRARAAIEAQLSRCRFGESRVVVPPHTTAAGRALEMAYLAAEILESPTRRAVKLAPWLSALSVPLTIAKVMPMIMVPAVTISCDPFLFIELPGEHGKLRHLGHWYWQDRTDGTKQLHLHV